jgi:hypothetical protein
MVQIAWHLKLQCAAACRPQAVCSRYGLAVGSYSSWLVRILMIVCWPIGAHPLCVLLSALIVVSCLSVNMCNCKLLAAPF